VEIGGFTGLLTRGLVRGKQRSLGVLELQCGKADSDLNLHKAACCKVL